MPSIKATVHPMTNGLENMNGYEINAEYIQIKYR